MRLIHDWGQEWGRALLRKRMKNWVYLEVILITILVATLMSSKEVYQKEVRMVMERKLEGKRQWP